MRVLARLAGERRPVDLPATRAALHARGLGEVPRAARGRLQPGDDGAGRAGVHAAQPALRRLPAGGRLPRARRAAGRRRCRASGRARHARSCASSAPASPTARACWWSSAAGAARGDLGAARGGRLPRRARAPGRRARALAEATGVRVGGGRLPGRGPPCVHPSRRHRRAVPRRRRARRRRAGAGSHRWVSPDGLAALGVSSFARKTVRSASDASKRRRSRTGKIENR